MMLSVVYVCFILSYCLLASLIISIQYYNKVVTHIFTSVSTLHTFIGGIQVEKDKTRPGGNI